MQITKAEIEFGLLGGTIIFQHLAFTLAVTGTIDFL